MYHLVPLPECPDAHPTPDRDHHMDRGQTSSQALNLLLIEGRFVFSSEADKDLKVVFAKSHAFSLGPTDAQ